MRENEQASSYRLLYGKSRVLAQDMVQLCRAINAVEAGHGFKILVYDGAGQLIGSGLYSRAIAVYIKCIAPFVFWTEGMDEIGAAIGLGERINARSQAVADFLALQMRLIWSAARETRMEDEE